MANIPTAQNNPGDLRGSTSTFQDFTDPLSGQAALYNDLTAKMTGNSRTGLNGNSTLYEFAQKYDPKGDGSNDPVSYAANLANQLKVSPDTKIGTLMPRIDDFAKAVATNEGYKGKWAAGANQVNQPSTYDNQDNTPLYAKIGSGLSSIFGGKYIGDYIGTKIAEASPDAQRLRQLDPSLQGQNLFQTPSGKQIAGDVLQAGTNIGAAALPGAGGLLGKTLQGAALGYGYDVANSLQNNQANFKPGFGTATGAALPLASKVLGGTAKSIWSALGISPEAIQRVFNNPAISQNPELKQGLLSDAVDALKNYGTQRNTAYGQAISGLVADSPIPKDLVSNSFMDEVQNFGGRVDDDGNLNFTNSKLTTTDKNNLTNAWNDIKGWTNVTPQGFDDLRQNLGNYMKDYKMQGNPRANVVLGNVKDTLTQYMKDHISGFGNILDQYGEKSDIMQNIADELQLGGKAKDTTKLANIMKIFKKDTSLVKNLGEVMGEDKANKFLDNVSGAILSKWSPRAGFLSNLEVPSFLGGLILNHPEISGTAAGVAAASSPKIAGLATRGAGALSKIPLIKAAMIQAAAKTSH